MIKIKKYWDYKLWENLISLYNFNKTCLIIYVKGFRYFSLICWYRYEYVDGLACDNKLKIYRKDISWHESWPSWLNCKVKKSENSSNCILKK